MLCPVLSPQDRNELHKRPPITSPAPPPPLVPAILGLTAREEVCVPCCSLAAPQYSSPSVGCWQPSSLSFLAGSLGPDTSPRTKPEVVDLFGAVGLPSWRSLCPQPSVSPTLSCQLLAPSLHPSVAPALWLRPSHPGRRERIPWV